MGSTAPAVVRVACRANLLPSMAGVRRGARPAAVRAIRHSIHLSAKSGAGGLCRSTRVRTPPRLNLRARCNAIDRKQLAQSPDLRKRTASASATTGKYLRSPAAQPTSDPVKLGRFSPAENPKGCDRPHQATGNEQLLLLALL